MVMVISGALAGLAGIASMACTIVEAGALTGYGYTAVVVAGR